MTSVRIPDLAHCFLKRRRALSKDSFSLSFTSAISDYPPSIVRKTATTLALQENKIYTILEKEYPQAHLETLIVVDGTTGQNALEQAREFSQVAPVDGIVLTKLDGTAKGGIAIAIQSELNIPVKFIGIGEKIDDLEKFDADSFVDALFQTDVTD